MWFVGFSIPVAFHAAQNIEDHFLCLEVLEGFGGVGLFRTVGLVRLG